MWHKLSTLVGLALLMAATFCGSATATPFGRNLLTGGETCPPQPQPCPTHCVSTSNCPQSQCCPDYHCEHDKCKPGPPPDDTCEGIVEKGGATYVKVCVPAGVGSPDSTNCGVGCYANCEAACEPYGGVKAEYAGVNLIPRRLCDNFTGGNCKAFELNGPCCGCNVDEACNSPPP